jgi:hypothetical protein
MPKKIDEAEVKKECPSCGLGVALDSRICEFCGWDFEEEDEWILQIEKLERDLMQEKQKFEPGTVNERIESTLHTPVLAQPETAKPETKPTAEPKKAAPPPAAKHVPPAPRETKEETEPVGQKPAAVKPAPPASVIPRTPEPVQQEAASQKTRRVRVVKAAPADATPETQTRKKLVRKVKQ